ncbi:uncharacterized protein LOC112521545 isoform X1 [Cynara cardunculus var. scolymus]|uniref:WIYLD domain-containing protein n=1 Tax=Cynara cardunculus var. scolymus TaxID=59895 RepID=A0A103XGT8_CYNCS|nr:uncharacterized protein LOC112521545 isoform X1 [Cynara cardunculus var. scolymus]KVH90422.1 WIYLD domain-containing protein [Cynara cardunculus var. scolymus]
MPLECLPYSPTKSSYMASKRRRKMGLTRMDAALDQMSTFGFSRQLVRKTVRDLLKLYGDDGWILIEEDGYKVLIDVLLDEQETEQTRNLLKDASSEIENTGNELVTVESNEVAAEDASFNGNNNASLTNYTGSENKECLKDIALDKSTLKSPFDTCDNHSADEVNLQCSKDPPVSELASIAANTPVNVSVGRRKPCYGWISDDDCDEETKFIALTPAI